VISDAEVAELYDEQNAWDPDAWPSDGMFHELVMAADSVLDVGCGTGSMLRRARVEGHVGRLAGIDPDAAMLGRARRYPEIEWVAGSAADAAWDREFELATMANHVFQNLVGDQEVRASLAAIRAALRDGGAFVFETRNPALRAWESWAAAGAEEVVTPSGRLLRCWYEIESVERDVVRFAEVSADADGAVLRTDRTTFRFMDVPTLNGFLAEAGFEVESQWGWWDRSPVGDEGKEIITVARRV
jgi:SAM-dependent methyltransferase